MEKLTYDGLRVGVVGCGEIVQHAHVPMYERLGIRVTRAFDPDEKQLGAVLAQCRAARRASSFEDITSAPDVDFVDIAVPPRHQLAVAMSAIDAGKPVLCQKPLAATLAEAVKLAEYGQRASVPVVVNHQMRWSPLIRHTNEVLRTGKFGRLVYASVNCLHIGTIPPGHWISVEPRFMCLFNTIHIVDSFRFLFGEPTSVRGSVAGDRSQNITGDVSVSAMLLWPNGGVAFISDHLTNRPQQPRSDVWLDGTGGAIFGRIGIWDKYPYPSPDEVSFQSAGSSSAILLSNAECWIPDAFAGPISEIAEAVLNKRPPTVSAIDAVRTMRLIEAVYESSANEGRLVTLPM